MIYTKQYVLEKGIYYENNILFDSRIKNAYLISSEEEQLVLQNISKKADKKIEFNDRKQEKSIIKILTKDDFIRKRINIWKVVISTKNIINTLLKLTICFFVWYILIYIFLATIAGIANFSNEVMVDGIKVLWSSIYFHELGHIFSYITLEKDKLFYIVISMTQTKVVTKETTKRNKKMIAFGGPIFSIFVNIIIFLVSKNVWFVYAALFHIVFLSPVTQDGKIIWFE